MLTRYISRQNKKNIYPIILLSRDMLNDAFPAMSNERRCNVMTLRNVHATLYNVIARVERKTMVTQTYF